MGTGLTKSLAKTHGPMDPEDATGAGGGARLNSLGGPGVRRSSSERAVGLAAGGVAGAPVVPNSGYKPSPLAADDDEADNPLGDGGGGGSVNYTQLEAILGPPGSAAKYIKKRPIGKGAYGEAYIVERNAAYDPASCPLAERQVRSNQLAHPTRTGAIYVIKVMDLRNMRLQDRQYAQTEIVCIAHTHHFAIIRYYEHYVLDSGDETMVIVTEFADHGDLARNLSRGRDGRFPAAELVSPPVTTAANAQSSSGAFSGGGVETSNPGGQTGSPSSPNPQQYLGALHLTEKEAGMYFVQLLAALHHIHKRRMIHRDVKSANLFLNSHGFIKLGDFGFSQKYESTVSSETIAGTFLGTPYYVSPEMWKGTRYGKKADVWAAGIVLYEMLMDGQRPFEAMGLTDLKRVVLEREVVLPEYPPGVDPATPTAAGASSAQAGMVKRSKFSPEIRELVRLIFQKDPQKRPSTEELLRTPIMQHYLFLFQRHVESLIEQDAALKKENPSVDATQLAFPDEADKTLVLEGLAELNEIIKQEAQKERDEPGALRYEGVVYKGNRDGTWKERYLAIEDDVLVISLSRAKSAAEGAERSRKVPMKLVKAVNMCQPTDPHVQPPEGASGSYVPPFSFVIFMQESSNPIYFGVATAEALDSWMKVLMRALHVD